MKKQFFILCMFLITGCNSNEVLVSDTTSTNLLKKQWVHSFEEESDSIQIYRPDNYKEFPAAHYRQKYNLAYDGRCKYLVLSPNDAHYFENGTWAYNENDQVLKICNTFEEVVVKFKVVALTEDLLMMLTIN